MLNCYNWYFNYRLFFSKYFQQIVQLFLVAYSVFTVRVLLMNLIFNIIALFIYNCLYLFLMTWRIILLLNKRYSLVICRQYSTENHQTFPEPVKYTSSSFHFTAKVNLLKYEQYFLCDISCCLFITNHEGHHSANLKPFKTQRYLNQRFCSGLRFKKVL